MFRLFPLSTILWFCVISLIFHHNNAQPKCHPKESLALLKLEINSEYNWNKSTNCCAWEGVECDLATGHVSILRVSLKSKIIAPDNAIFSLRHLTSLTLYPTGLDFEHKFLSKSAFKSLTRNLNILDELDLSFIDMSSIPLASLANLPSSLTRLSLGECRLRGKIPDDVFVSLSNLEQLDLSRNSLSGQIPRSIFYLGNLSTLGLYQNSFSSKLPEFCGPQIISSNCLVGRLSSSLTRLWLDHNFFDGPLPSWIYELPIIEEVVLKNNRFSGEIGDFRTPLLRVLDLSHNKLHGGVPRSLFQNKKLDVLDLSSNNFTGALMFEDISKLSYLNISSTNLTISSGSQTLH